MSDAEKSAAEFWGPRCPDYEPECPTCQVWQLLDTIAALRAENAELLKRVVAALVRLGKLGAENERLRKQHEAAFERGFDMASGLTPHVRDVLQHKNRAIEVFRAALGEKP